MGILPTSIPTSLDQINPFSNGVASEELGPSLTIQELTGEQRALILKGRALPYRPASFGRGVQRTHKTTYQGNPQSTQQVLGPEETEATLEGMWKSRFIGGCVQQVGFPREVTAAADLVEFVDSIRQAGQTVQVQWGPELRVGILVAFEATWERVQDVRWTIDFEWQSRGAVTTKARRSAARKPGLLDKLNALSDVLALGPEFLLPDVNAMLVSTISEVRKKIGQMFDALMVVARIGRLPADVAGSIVANATGLRAQLLEGSNAVSEVPVTEIVSVDDLIVLTEAEFWRRDVATKMQELLEEVSIVEQQTTERASPPPVAVVEVKQWTTLYQISQEQYGTPDLAGFIADVNDHQEIAVAPGTVLIIPPKPQET